MGGGSQVLKRIPRIKFPQRHPKPSSSSSSDSGLNSQPEQKATIWTRSSSEVPLPPQNFSEGGKASLQPKRTPVTSQEIEAVMIDSPERQNKALRLATL